jgi:hypothetical protein
VHEVGKRARHNALVGGFRRGAQALLEPANNGATESSSTVEQARQHGRLLIE